MDILTCGTCQTGFALADITLFIQHKKQDCDEDHGRRIRNSHSGLVCSSCSKTFRCAWDLLQHVQQAHSLRLYEEKACDDRFFLRGDEIADHSGLPSSPSNGCSSFNTYQTKCWDTGDDGPGARKDNTWRFGLDRAASNSDVHDGSVLSPRTPQVIENNFEEQKLVPLDLKISTRGHEVTSVPSSCPSDADNCTNSPSCLYIPCSIENSPKSKHIPTIPKKRKWANLVQDDGPTYSPQSNISSCTSPNASPPNSPDTGLRATLDPSHKGSFHDICEKADDPQHVPRMPVPLKWKFSQFSGSSNGVYDFARFREGFREGTTIENNQHVQRENNSPPTTGSPDRSHSPNKSQQMVHQRHPLVNRGGLESHSEICAGEPLHTEFIQRVKYHLKSEDNPGIYTPSQLSNVPQYSSPVQIRNDYTCAKDHELHASPKSPDSSGLEDFERVQDDHHQNYYSKGLLTDPHGFGKKRRYPTSRPFKCDHCDHSFNQRIHLKKHLSKHTGVKPFKCSLCDYSTVERSHLKVHIRIHTGEKPFKCTFCDYATAQNSTLKIHLKRHHGGKMFECTECGKCFTQVNSLDSHVRVHHSAVSSSDQPPSFVVSGLEADDRSMLSV